MPRVKTFDREETLRKAMDLFWKKGYHASSMQDLVEYMGITRSSIYDTFRDKEHLFLEALALYRRESGRYLQGVEEVLKGDNARSFIRSFFQRMAEESVRDAERKGCLIANTTAEVCDGIPEAGRMLRENQVRFLDLFSRLIRVGQERGEIRAGRAPEELALFLFTFMNGLRLLAKLDNRPEVLNQAIEAAMEAL